MGSRLKILHLAGALPSLTGGWHPAVSIVNNLDSTPLSFRLGLSEGALKVAIHRLRKRFREAILLELRQTLPDTDDPEDELRYLIEVLSQA